MNSFKVIFAVTLIFLLSSCSLFNSGWTFNRKRVLYKALEGNSFPKGRKLKRDYNNCLVKSITSNYSWDEFNRNEYAALGSVYDCYYILERAIKSKLPSYLR